jgi:hypothetical protein
MRAHYDLKAGRKNPYAARVGAKGRRAMMSAFEGATRARILDDDLAELFPDSKAVNDALRVLAQISKRSTRGAKKRGVAA